MRKNILNKFIDILEHLATRTVIIVPHEQTDIDAYASAFGLRKLLHALNFNSLVFLPKPTRELKQFIETLNLPIFYEDKEKIADLIRQNRPFVLILVDFSTPERLTEKMLIQLVSTAQKVIALDHHIPSESKKVNHQFIVNYSSTSEIIFMLFKLLNKLSFLRENKELANTLLAGILFDTNFLLNANETTFRILSELYEFTDYKLIWRILRGRHIDISERIAKLKGAQRANIIKLDETLLVFTEVGSYESSVASALISLGADIAIVLSKKGELIRVSSRTTLSNLNLAEIFQKVAEKLNGIGGGHPNAAVLTIKKSTDKKRDIRKLINIISELILEEIKKD